MKTQAPICSYALRHNQRRMGQATLSFIILISGLILEIAIAGSFVTYFLSSSGLGERLYVRALTVAQSSVRDAQMHIVRDKEFGASPLLYSFSLNGDTSNVTVSRVSSGSSYVYSITAIGVAGTRQRKFVAVIAADQITGLTDLQSLNEQTVQ